VRLNWRDAHVCSGDVLLFSSTPSFVGDVEKLMCGSPYTHVALVFVDAAGEPFVWDCTRFGHRVRPLSHAMHGNAGTVMWRRISKPVNSAAFETFIVQNMDEAYSFNLWQGVVRRWASWLHLPHTQPCRDQQSRFCSQLVAETLVYVGAMDFCATTLAPLLVMPGDFAMSRVDVLPWVHGYSLSGEVELV
jgi:hypothetical protein